MIKYILKYGQRVILKLTKVHILNFGKLIIQKFMWAQLTMVAMHLDLPQQTILKYGLKCGTKYM